LKSYTNAQGLPDVMKITVGTGDSRPHREVVQPPCAGQACIAAESNSSALPEACEVKRVYLLPDVSGRFKGFFVAVPQIAFN
jgi:hypothetical protein